MLSWVGHSKYSDVCVDKGESRSAFVYLFVSDGRIDSFVDVVYVE